MDLLQQIVARAKADKQRIVLPEAEEERTLRAADKVLADDMANVILIGNPDNIKKLAKEWGLGSIDKATIIDPMNNPKSEEYAEKLAELRKNSKNIAKASAKRVDKFTDAIEKKDRHLCECYFTEGDSALNELMSQFHELDRQKLRQLIRTANKERELNKPPVAYREMYQYLRGEIEDQL